MQPSVFYRDSELNWLDDRAFAFDPYAKDNNEVAVAALDDSELLHVIELQGTALQQSPNVSNDNDNSAVSVDIIHQNPMIATSVTISANS